MRYPAISCRSAASHLPLLHRTWLLQHPNPLNDSAIKLSHTDVDFAGGFGLHVAADGKERAGSALPVAGVVFGFGLDCRRSSKSFNSSS